ncbi:MAG: hypothetical protein JXA60_05590 [Candidatus Coatesbacteria bacterium]|nr:hypothetical protein [Candidatus Coatesbacteria bacterium]
MKKTITIMICFSIASLFMTLSCMDENEIPEYNSGIGDQTGYPAPVWEVYLGSYSEPCNVWCVDVNNEYFLASGNNAVRHWFIGFYPQLKRTTGGLSGDVLSAAFVYPNQQYPILVGQEDGYLLRFRWIPIMGGEKRDTLNIKKTGEIPIHAIDVSNSDPQKCLIARYDTVEYWQTVLPKEFEKLKTYTIEQGVESNTYIWSIDFCSGDQYFITGGFDKNVYKWNISVQYSLFHFEDHSLEGLHPPSHKDRVRSVKVASNSSFVLSGGNDGKLKKWDLNGNLICTFNGHSDRPYGFISSITITDDNCTAVTGGDDGEIRVWDVQNNNAFAIAGFHVGGVHSVAILKGASGTNYILSSGADGKVKCWNIP